MNDVIKVDGNKISINCKTIKFKYDIRDTRIVNNQVIVLLSIPFNVKEIDNIYAVSLDGRINWRVESLDLLNPSDNNLPYENIFLNNGELTATDFYGTRYFINIINGAITKKDIVR